ncbi:MAG TPA: methylmalonyl-CoA mutase family protein [Bacteroidales bacterium]|nr:methylmalonyl-CoA mutase family protein [Bacteroidales bacterium]
MAEKENLFADFPETSTEDWMEKVKKDLKGADFERKLVWRTLEGFNIMPFYRLEDLQNKEYLNTHPGEFPYTRGTEVNNDWLVRQDINVDNVKAANKKALNILNKGVTAIGFNMKRAITPEELEQLLDGIVLEALPVYFNSPDSSGLYSRLLADYVEKKGLDKTKIQGAEDFDSLGFLVLNGFMPCGKSICDCTEKLLKDVKDRLPAYRPVSVNAKHFQNAGSNLTQELAFAMAMGVQYLDSLTEAGMSIDEVAPRMQFNFAAGSNYFMEIAKLRAARTLWAKIAESYKPEKKESAKMHAHVETATWNMTVYDPYVNMLRATTEAMSAALGGAESINVLPSNIAYEEPTEFSERMARNIQLILKEESHFDKVQDPAAGSYYIENLTEKIAEEAWKLFLEVEEAGGFKQAFKDNLIQSKIDETITARKKKMALRKEVLVGTTQYPNSDEQMDEDIDINRLFKSQKKDTGNGRPLRIFRIAEEFEAMRLKTDNSKTTPKVFMLTVGHPAMRSARSQFAANFFAVAGFDIINNIGFDSVEEGYKAAKEAGASIIVLCSSDEEYEAFGKELADMDNGKTMLVVAGNPACKDELKKAGIDRFVHVKSDILATLSEIQTKLGI